MMVTTNLPTSLSPNERADEKKKIEKKLFHLLSLYFEKSFGSFMPNTYALSLESNFIVIFLLW